MILENVIIISKGGSFEPPNPEPRPPPPRKDMELNTFYVVTPHSGTYCSRKPSSGRIRLKSESMALYRTVAYKVFLDFRN